ncbi:MAG: low molecular weight protein arginine phosphatase [Deltaproteobacteria bacterium]|nr:MAG: low molecular weight protein arginine phosphatase [Deltaproteobacteria bacterium]
MERQVDILIVCSGNLCRSPMAEGILKKRLREAGLSHLEVASAGTIAWPGRPPAEQAVLVAREKAGIDLSPLRSTTLTPELIERSRFVVVMERYHAEEVRRLSPDFPEERLILLGRFASPPGDIFDPYLGPIEGYRRCFDELSRCLEAFLEAYRDRL